ncbi:relaxase/mobilization nuclease domain-containing protein [Salinibacter ruber]|uniref:DNA primase n=1 Tax=Salinibacter ruber TaxID=146919 RepID=A0A9X2TIX6_9BACT|nr:relaxase/mobilization nuclease domain-containing protein [Salinibacter ruber]MCS3660144.1 DNA primase [Salinibacter ruber]MCS3709829.1 DNA primase [Salinibacter ruber]MCS4170342.1 DNA primase [Salinibacter ruber]
MIAESHLQSNVDKLGDYLSYGRSANNNHVDNRRERVGWEAGRNLGANPTMERAKAKIKANANKPSVEKPVYQIIVSWQSGNEEKGIPPDDPSQEEMEWAVDRIREELGLEEHYAWMVGHADTDTPHVHVVIGRVHPRTKETWKTSYEKTKIYETLREIEEEMGWHRPGPMTIEEKWEQKTAESEDYWEETHEKWGRERSVRLWAREEGIADEMKAATSWPEAQKALRGTRALLKPRGDRGMVLKRKGKYAALSAIDAQISRPKLEERFGQTWDEYRRERRAKKVKGHAGDEGSRESRTRETMDGLEHNGIGPAHIKNRRKAPPNNEEAASDRKRLDPEEAGRSGVRREWAENETSIVGVRNLDSVTLVAHNVNEVMPRSEEELSGRELNQVRKKVEALRKVEESREDSSNTSSEQPAGGSVEERIENRYASYQDLKRSVGKEINQMSAADKARLANQLNEKGQEVADRATTFQRNEEIYELASEFYQKRYEELPPSSPKREYIETRTHGLGEEMEIGHAPNDWHAFENYAKERGYSEEDLLEAGMVRERADGEGVYDTMKNSVVAFSRNEDGQVRKISYRWNEGTRNPKMEAPNFKKMTIGRGGDDVEAHEPSEAVFGWEEAQSQEGDEVLVTEGFSDAAAARSAGYNAVAVGGRNITEEKADIINETADEKPAEVTVMLDGDDAGRVGSIEVVQEMEQRGASVEVVRPPEDADIDEMVVEEGEAAVSEYIEANRTDGLEYVYENAATMKGQPTEEVRPEERAERMRRAIDVATSAPTPERREENFERLLQMNESGNKDSREYRYKTIRESFENSLEEKGLTQPTWTEYSDEGTSETREESGGATRRLAGSGTAEEPVESSVPDSAEAIREEMYLGEEGSSEPAIEEAEPSAPDSPSETSSSERGADDQEEPVQEEGSPEPTGDVDRSAETETATEPRSEEEGETGPEAEQAGEAERADEQRSTRPLPDALKGEEEDIREIRKEWEEVTERLSRDYSPEEAKEELVGESGATLSETYVQHLDRPRATTAGSLSRRGQNESGENRSAQPPGYYSEETPEGREMQDKIVGAEGLEDRIREREDLQGETIKGKVRRTEDGDLQIERISKSRTSFGEKGAMPDVAEEEVDIIVAEVRSGDETKLYAVPASTRDRVKVPEEAFRQTNREEDRQERIERLQSQDEQRAFEARTRHIGRSSRAKLFDQAGTSGDDESMVSVPNDAPAEDRLKVAADVNYDAVRNAEVTDGEYRDVDRVGGRYETSRSDTPIEFELGDDPEGIYENSIEEIDVEQPGKFADANGEFSYPSERGHYYGQVGHSEEEFEEFADNQLRERWSEILKEEYVDDLETDIREELEENGVREDIEASVRESVEFDIDEDLREEYREKVGEVKAEVEAEFDREISDEELNEQLEEVQFREEIEDVRGALESERRDPEEVIEERVERRFEDRVSSRLEERLEGEDLDRRVRGDLDRIIDEKVEEFEPVEDVEREGFEGPQDDLDRRNIGDVVPAEVEPAEGEADYEIVRAGAVKTGAPDDTAIDASEILEDRLEEERVALEYRAQTLREVREDLDTVEDLDVERGDEQRAPGSGERSSGERPTEEEATDTVTETEAVSQAPSSDRVRWDEVEETLETREDLLRRQEMGRSNEEDIESQLQAVNDRLDKQLRGVETDTLRERYTESKREVASQRQQQSALNAEQEETAREIGERNTEMERRLNEEPARGEGRPLEAIAREREELAERQDTLLEEQNELIQKENRSETVARGYRREVERRGEELGEDAREAEAQALEADLEETWTARNASRRVEDVSREGREIFEDWREQSSEEGMGEADVDLDRAVEREEERREQYESIRTLENNALQEKRAEVESNERADVPAVIKESTDAEVETRASNRDTAGEGEPEAEEREERDRMTVVGEYVRERSKVSGDEAEVMDRQVDIEEVEAYRKEVNERLEEAQSETVEQNRRIGELNQDLRSAGTRLEEAGENEASTEAASAYGEIETALDRRENASGELAAADQRRRKLREQAYRTDEILNQRKGDLDDEEIGLSRRESLRRTEIEYEKSRRLDRQSAIEEDVAGQVNEYAVNDEVDANLEERLRASASESKTKSLRAEERRATAAREFQRREKQADARDLPEIEVRDEAVAGDRGGQRAEQEVEEETTRQTSAANGTTAEAGSPEEGEDAPRSRPRDEEGTPAREEEMSVEGVEEYVDRRRDAGPEEKEVLDEQVEVEDLKVHRSAVDEQLREVQEQARDENRRIGEINDDLEDGSDRLRTAVENGDDEAAAEAYSEIKYGLERRAYAEERLEAANRGRNDLSQEAHDVNQILSERTGEVDDEAVVLGGEQTQNRLEIETERARRLNEQTRIDEEIVASTQAYRTALNEDLDREGDEASKEAFAERLEEQEAELQDGIRQREQQREVAQERAAKEEDRLRGFQQVAEKRGLEVQDPSEEETSEQGAAQEETGVDESIEYPTGALGAGEIERRREELVEERESLQQKVQEVREEANQIGRQRQALENQLTEDREGDADLTSEEIRRRKAELKSLKEEFQARQGEIEQVKRKISAIDEEIEALNEEIESRAAEDDQEQAEQTANPETEEEVSSEVEAAGEQEPVEGDLENTDAIRAEKERLEAIQAEYRDEAESQADYVERGTEELNRRALRMREMVKAGASTSVIERTKDEFEQRRGVTKKAEEALAENRQKIQRAETQIARLEQTLEKRDAMQERDYKARAERLEAEKEATSQLSAIEGEREKMAERTADAMDRLANRVEKEPGRTSPDGFDPEEQQRRYEEISGRAAIAEEGFDEQRQETARRAEEARENAEQVLEGRSVLGESTARTKAKEDLARVRQTEAMAQEAFGRAFEDEETARAAFNDEAYAEGVDPRTRSYREASDRLVRRPERYGSPEGTSGRGEQGGREDLERAARRAEAATASRQAFRSKYGREPEEMAERLGEDSERLSTEGTEAADPQAREQAARELRQREERRAEALEERFLEAAEEKFDQPDAVREAYEVNTTMYDEQTAREALKTPVAYKGQDKVFKDPGSAVGGSNEVQETLRDIDSDLREVQRRIDRYEEIEETARRQQAERVAQEPVAQVGEDNGVEQTTWDQIQGPSQAQTQEGPSRDEVKRAKETFQDQVEERRTEEEVEDVLDLVETAQKRQEAEEIERHFYESARATHRRGAQSLNEEATRLDEVFADAYQDRRAGQRAGELIRNDEGETVIRELAEENDAPQEIRDAADAIQYIEEKEGEVQETEMLKAGVRRENDVLKQTARWEIKEAERASRSGSDQTTERGESSADETMQRVETALNEAKRQRLTSPETEGYEEQIRERVEQMSPEAEAELRSRSDTDPRAEEALAIERRRSETTDIGTPGLDADRSGGETETPERERDRGEPSPDRSRGRGR